MPVLAIPKPDSYVSEWSALRWQAVEGLQPVKRFLRYSGWVTQLVITDVSVTVVATCVHHNEIEQWTVADGDWIVKSPFGKVWFMGDTEFKSQFTWQA